MKKICMVAYTNYLSDARPRREAETLARRGDKVDFISLAEKDRPAVEMVNGVRVLRVGMMRYRGGSGVSYLFSYLRFIATASLKLLRLSMKERYDNIHVHTMPDIAVVTGLIPKLFGAKLILDIHDMMPELYMSKFNIPETHPLIRVIAAQEQFSIWLADRVICVHEPHRSVLVRRGARPSKITVIPNVPDPNVFPFIHPQPPTEGVFRMVYHGTIARRLGLDLAVEAFVKIAKDYPNAKLEILGDGDAANDLEKQIEATGMQDRIYFSKRLFRVEEATEMIQGASVGLIPNRFDSATNYMLPVKLLEYVYFAIPVIAPRLLAIQHYFSEDQVAYYEPGNVDDLAATIRRLYENPAERYSLAVKSSAFAQDFHWNMLKNVLFDVEDGNLPARTFPAASPAATADAAEER
ncbi:MAG: glycosyltransferase family 4 protein [Terracidiphilus sp.]|nr:glycosyltransferase family 4 protein [Terracidiphilus sp.]